MPIAQVTVPVIRTDQAGAYPERETLTDLLKRKADEEQGIKTRAESAVLLAQDLPQKLPDFIANDMGLVAWPIVLALASLLSRSVDVNRKNEPELQV